MRNDHLKEKDKFSLEELISFMPGHVYWLNKENVYLGCNSLQAKANGLSSPEEIIGKRNKDLPSFKDHPEIPAVLDKNNSEIMNSGVTQSIEERTVINGVEKIVLTQKVPLKNNKNEVMGLLGISFDITERKQAEKNLKETKQNLEIALENIIANIPGHVYWKDINGVFLGANDEQAKTLGYSSGKDLIGKTAYDTIPKADAEIITKNDKVIMSTGKPISIEEISPTSDGSPGIYVSKKSPLFDQNKNIIGIIGISMDITDFKKAEKALADQKLYAAQTRFISTASHEVRGPVANAINLSQASQEHLDEIKNMFHGEIADMLSAAGKGDLINQFNQIYHQISECHSKAKQESYRALNSLISIGELFALQRDGVKVKIVETDIKKLVDSVVETLEKSNHHGIQFRVEIPANFPIVLLDQRNLQQALTIFVNNAMRFSHDKGLVKIKVNPLILHKQEYIEIIVQDYGMGIAESQIENLFSMAIGEDEDRSDHYRKPSLQLPQAKMRLEASGGTVKIESALNKGTSLIINFPVKNTMKDVSSIKLESAAPDQTIPRQKLLLVEDDLLTQQMYQQHLVEFGHDVDVASTGSEAVKLALKNDYDIIFLDISLPDMSGIDVVRKIRKQKGDDATFVAITSHASDDDLDYFTNDEIDIMTVLTKPVAKHELKACLEDVIAAKMQDDEDE